MRASIAPEFGMRSRKSEARGARIFSHGLTQLWRRADGKKLPQPPLSRHHSFTNFVIYWLRKFWSFPNAFTHHQCQ
jgi:hypothetical protein